MNIKKYLLDYFQPKVTYIPQDLSPIPITFSWYIIIESGTVEHTCAIDAGLKLIRTDRDMLTYSTTDKDIWIEFEKYRKANSKAILKEQNDRYRY
jgi:hypothetical protein